MNAGAPAGHGWTPLRGRPRSLAARLACWYSVSAAALILLVGSILYFALSRALDADADRFLEDQVRVLRAILDDDPVDLKGLIQEAELEAGAHSSSKTYVRVIDAAGKTVVESPGMAQRLPMHIFPTPVAAADRVRRGFTVAPAGRRPYRCVAAYAAGAHGELYQIQSALDRDRIEDLLGDFALGAAGICGAGVAAAALLAVGIARRGVAPLRAVADAARATNSANLSTRIDPAGLPTEVADLATMFNEMLARLERSFSQLSQFSADLAHELRTPIANLRGQIEVTLARPRAPQEYQDQLRSSLEDTVRLGAVVDGLLFLARAQAGSADLRRQPLCAAGEFARFRALYESAAEEAGIELAVDAPAGLVIAADATLLQRALSNLVNNAIDHTPRGGHIRIAARAGGGGGAVVTVTDDGCGIAAEHLPRVFDRFYRGDSARRESSGGFGLGLSIVRSIAELHGGRADVESQPGRGTAVTLHFPEPASP